MSLDDLIEAIPDAETELRKNLVHWVDDWKRNDQSLEALEHLIERWHGNVWFKDAATSNTFHRSWLNFKAEAIDNIGGMTMNERLYIFGLLDLWDASKEKERDVLRIKLKADA